MCDFRVEKLTSNMVEDVFEIEKAFFDVSTKQTILDSFKSNNLFYFVLYFKNEVVGFLEGSIVLDEAELFEIAIKKEYQGKKFSHKLMEYFLDYCQSNKVETIFLEVNIINIKAISLYKKYGFEQYGIRKKYYGENDAVLMKYTF